VGIADGRRSPLTIVVERQTPLAVVAGRMMLTPAHQTSQPRPGPDAVVMTTPRVVVVVGINAHALARVSVALTPVVRNNRRYHTSPPVAQSDQLTEHQFVRRTSIRCRHLVNCIEI